MRRAALVLAAAAVLAGVDGTLGASERAERRSSVRWGAPKPLPWLATVDASGDLHDLDLSSLIAPGTRLRRVWYLRGGSHPDQVLVEWVRSSVVSDQAVGFPDGVRWGLTLWTPAARRPQDAPAWRGVAIPLLRLKPGLPYTRVAIADVTSDRHPDVLVEQYSGNHGCGRYQVVATGSGRAVWWAFRAWLCEARLGGAGGLLAVDVASYETGDRLCCPSGIEQLRLRWTGRRYAVVSDRIVPR